MPALPRLDLAHVPQHITQRGVDRCACFLEPANQWRYLKELQRAAVENSCAVHAYVLMSNHVHLLVTPAAQGAAGRMMQQLGTRYVRYFNTRYERTGTLWEGRFRSCLIDSDQYLLACLRYIELNPVRAGLARSAADYPWSSYRCNAEGLVDPVVTPHATYLALGKDSLQRQRRYSELVSEGLSREHQEQIRLHTRQGAAWGSTQFQSALERSSGRTLTPRPRGRPRK